MNEMQTPRGSVVVGVDGSPESSRAVTWAARLAHDQGRPLALLHAVRSLDAERMVGLVDSGYDRQRVLGALTASGQELVRSAAADVAERSPEVEVVQRVLIGDPRTALLDAAADGARVLVVGSRGRGPVASALLGSVSAFAARYAPCPVVVVRPHHPGKVRHGVLVGADATPGCHEVLEAAFRTASERALPLTVLQVVWQGLAGAGVGGALADEDLDEAQLALAEALAGVQEKYPDVHVRVLHTDGIPAARLITESDHMDLVVVGRHDRGLVNRLVHGSVSLSVVEHAQCPVLIVPTVREERLDA
jgi:nucleotide-binding universal stress UspA family protein